ncbi:MAG: GlsB/YeaQ/YmgE family stress response membrane protein [Thermomonas sp.]|uniref:GlsB/YeaQ/YmgE family stress response membrane protein n=1 Tax=Thermomonas sp. TaxID=1971895 RepID=UPI0039E65B73
MFSGIFGYIFGGLVIGVLARLVKPGADPMGWIMTIILGIVGAVIGGWASGYFGLGRTMTWVAAIVAAVVLLFVYEAMRKKR